MAFDTVGNGEAFAPNVHAFAPEKELPAALVLQAATQLATVEGDGPVVLVPSLDDIGNPDTVVEGGAISPEDATASHVEIRTSKIARLQLVSREQRVQPGFDSLLTGALRRSMQIAGDVAFLGRTGGTPPAVQPVAGILNQPLTDDLDPVAGSLDPVVDAVAHIEGNYGVADVMVCAPDVWAFVRKLKTGTGSNQSLLGAGGEDSVRRLLSVPVIVNAAMPAGKLLVADRGAILSAVGNITYAISEDYAFNQDAIAVRATWRFGAVVADPERVVLLDVEAGDGE